jgi:hypothetical protein
MKSYSRLATIDPASSTAIDDRLAKLIKDSDAHHILVLPNGYADQVAAGEVPNFKCYSTLGDRWRLRLSRSQSCKQP